MYIPLRRFWSVEELAPLFEHGGQVSFEFTVQSCCYSRGESQPWEIVIRTWKGLKAQQEELLHEFVHLFHNSHCGYRVDPNETWIFNETETERQTKRLINRNPGIVDEITRDLILHPRCSVVFSSGEYALRNSFREYYQSLVAELATQACNGNIADQARRLKVLQLAQEVGT